MKYSTKNPRPLPPLDVLNEWFSYNSETGVLTWKKVSKYSSHLLGKQVGKLDQGYRKVKLDGVGYQAHRVAYYIGTGKEPRYIDHINGVRDDNRLENLRCVDHKTNMRNMSKRKDNSSGLTGLRYRGDLKRPKWEVRLSNKSIGFFTDKIDAIYARYWAERDAGYHENHGRV